MIRHILRQVTQFHPAIKVVSLMNHVLVIQFAHFSGLLPHAFVAHTALEDIAVAELVEKLASELLVQLSIAGTAETEDVHACSGTIDLRTAI